MSILFQELFLALRVYINSTQAEWIHLSGESKLHLFICLVVVCVALLYAYSTSVYEEVEFLTNQRKKGVTSSLENQERLRNELRGSSTAHYLYHRGGSLSGIYEGEETQSPDLRSRSQSVDDDEISSMAEGSMLLARDRESRSSRRRAYSSDSEVDAGAHRGDAVHASPLTRQEQHRSDDAQEMSMVSSIGEDDSNDAGDVYADSRGIQIIPVDDLHSFIDRFSRNGVIVSVYRKGAFRKRCLKLDTSKRCLYWKDDRRFLDLRKKRREWPIDNVVSLVELGVVRTEEITNSNRSFMRGLFGGGQELLIVRSPGTVTTNFVPNTTSAAGSEAGKVDNTNAPALELRVGFGSERRGSVEAGLAALLAPRGLTDQPTQDGSPRPLPDGDTKHVVALKLRSNSAPGKGKVYQFFFESRAEAHWLFRHFASLLYHIRSDKFRSGERSSLQSLTQPRPRSADYSYDHTNGVSGSPLSQRRADSLPGLEDDDSVDTYNTYLSSMNGDELQANSMEFPLGLSSHHKRGRNSATQTFQSLNHR